MKNRNVVRLGISLVLAFCVLLPAQAQPVLLIQITATSRTDAGTGSLGMVRIDSVTTCPTLEDPDVIIAVIDHILGATFVTYHLIPPHPYTGALSTTTHYRGYPAGTGRHSAVSSFLARVFMHVIMGYLLKVAGT